MFMYPITTLHISHQAIDFMTFKKKKNAIKKLGNSRDIQYHGYSGVLQISCEYPCVASQFAVYNAVQLSGGERIFLGLRDITQRHNIHCILHQ